MMWSGEARVIMWFINEQGNLNRHNFYHCNFSQQAVDRAEEYEYKKGFITWLEYRLLD